MELALRTSSRTQVTKLINAAKELLESNEAPVEEITVLLARLKTANENLKAANIAVRPLIAAANLERECEAVLDYDDRAVTAITQMQYRLSSRPVDVPTRVDTPLLAEATIRNTLAIKLPKLELRKFNGDLTAWIPFWEEFKTAVHQNNSLDGTTKFNYLRFCLTGKAAATISGFTPTEACYNDAITMLKEEYGATDRIVEKCMQNLMATNAVKTKNDISGLRHLYNNTSATMRSLKVLGIPVSQYAMMMKSILLRSIPNEMRTNFHRIIINDSGVNAVASAAGAGTNSNASRHSEESSTIIESELQVQRLLNFIKVEVDALEKSQDAFFGEVIKAERKPERKFNQITSTAAGLLAGVQNNNNNCVFCKLTTHVSAECNSQLTLEQRRNILKRESRCFRCTKRNHSSRYCKVKNIHCEKCNGRHVTAMCDPNYRERINQRNEHREPNVIRGGTSHEQSLNLVTNARLDNVAHNEQRERNVIREGTSHEQSLNLITHGQLDNVYLQAAYAFAIKPSDKFPEKLIRIILDGGSQLTFIKECVSRKLDLPIVGTHNISIIPFGSKDNTPARRCNKVELKLINQYNNEEILINAIEVPEICLDTLKVPKINEPLFRRFQLADAKVVNVDTLPGISLLIGADQYWRIVTGEVEKLAGELVAVNSKLGWTLHGPSPVDNCNVNLNIATVLSCIVNHETLEINNFWDLEAIGINEQSETYEEFTQQFSENSITFKNDRYEASLPWKNVNVNLDDNYNGALMRMKSLQTRLLKNGKLLEYDAAMFDYINNGIAQKVRNWDRNERIYYMPHRPVYRENKETTKVRVVFDASAHALGHSSLNDHLLSGTNLIPDLLKILINFRIGKVAITADIEKAFLQIALNESERDCHRFLWYEKPVTAASIKLPPTQIYRMTRLTFGVKSSPFILNATIIKHLNQQTQCVEICDILKESFYVDDLVLSVCDSDTGKTLHESAKSIMQRAGMNLRKWHSNDARLRELFKDAETTSKVLGLMWYEVADEIGVDLTPVIQLLQNLTQITKRNVLQVISRIYDPLGILGPFTITMKILLQDIWKLRPGWDDVLPIHLQGVWSAWKEQLQVLSKFSVPRCATNNEGELHLFADASPSAYGVVAYVKSTSSEENAVNLLCSKNRVAPLKNEGDKLLTLPRLELTAALLGARLANFIIKNSKIKISNVYLWSDSKIALYWIKGNAEKWKPYVANRVREIQCLTKTYEWLHCPGEFNPADLLTRGIKAKDLSESRLWMHGPLWLVKNSDYWPSDATTIDQRINDVAALKVTVLVENERVDPLFRWENYSELKKIIRITSFVLRFINNLKHRIKKTGSFSVEELNNAELYWVKHAQVTEYTHEVFSLKNGTNVDRKSKILSLNPFLDDNGIMRLGGRLQKAQLGFDISHPILLAKNSHLSELLIREAHNKLHHAGVNAILTKIREKFWIVRGRQLARAIVSRCIICKRLRGKAASQPFAPLPKERVMVAKPFETTGIDFAGPLYVKSNNELNKKTYIMLFTCAVVRAVHLELIQDLTTESCLRGLRRFMSRRGVPKNIYSDNAKTFKRSAKELEHLANFIDSQHLQDFIENHRIDWHFIIERAAWWGGWWERMVRTVKTALKSTVGKSNLEFDELRTVLIEVEGTINARPLTYVSEDPEEIQPLTPAHFLSGCSNLTLPTTFSVKNQMRKTEIVALWKQREQILCKFWKRWSTEYLQQLRSAHRFQQVLSSQLKIGEVVLIHDQGTPRLLWKMGRIVQVFPGRDGKVRACEIKTSNGKCLRRPIQLLHPLEIN